MATTNIGVKYTFIVGFPTETDEERNETIDFAQELLASNENAYSLFFVFANPFIG